MRLLVAGVGNVLRGDDGFGPAVVQALAARDDLPPGIRVVETGIGGIGLVHELMDGYDALVLVDAVERGGEPGSLYVLDVQVPEVDELSAGERYELSTDLHQAVPSRALILARAAGVLPPVVRMIGCQPLETDELCTELSPEVQQAVRKAVGVILRMIADGDARSFLESSLPLSAAE
jgi:hydrogenase maturation protease